ncbi:MAG: hypothetical protein GY953_05545, partial [bacterium]|nr:hypothetical protein [bacterium]
LPVLKKTRKTKAYSTGAETLEELAARYVAEIRTLQPEGPYFLTGFCMGAYVAHEMARQLQQAGQEIGLLAVIATDGSWKLVDSVTGGLRYHLHALSHRRGMERIRFLARRARYRLQRVQDAALEPLASALLSAGRPLPPIVRRRYLTSRHLRASRAHQPEAVRGRMVYFRGSNETERDFRTFWTPLVDGEIETHVVPGKEIELFTEPGVDVLAAKMRELMSTP